jgi:outer membrane receptor protein involved in Fe transport
LIGYLVKLKYSIWRKHFRYRLSGAGYEFKQTNKNFFLICVRLLPIIIFSLFVFSLQSLANIKGQIEGRVFDANTGKPLSEVNIIVVGTSLGTDSKKDGSYQIINISPGTYEIQARGIGYLPLTVTGITVEVDHSTLLNLKLFAPRTVKGRDVTLEAKKEILKKDISSKRYYSTIEEINEIPFVSSLEDYLAIYPGIVELGYRERKTPRNMFVTDGFSLSDNRINTLILSPPLSAVENIVVLDGGFDAAYGNTSSGVINVREKEGRRDSYHGSANFQYTFPHIPHEENGVFNPSNVHIRPFVDTTDSLCWNGTTVLPEEEADDYEDFDGWIQYSRDRENEGDTLTPEEWRNLFMYIYRVEGSEALGQIPGTYGDKPGYMFDFGFGGPFPAVNKITFFVSNVRNIEPFSLPVTRENYLDNKTDWKITFHIKPEVKLNVKGLFETVQTVTRDSRQIYPDGRIWAGSGDILGDVAGKDFMYWVDALNPYNIRRYAWGLDLSHSLGSSTFYNLRLFYSRSRHLSKPIWEETDYPENYRNTTDLIYFGNIGIPAEIPFGYESFPGNYCYYRNLLPSDFVFSNFGRIVQDASWVNTINFNVEVNSQITSHHQLETGIQINHDRIYSAFSNYVSGGTREQFSVADWEAEPLQAGLYIQDKFSFENAYTKFGLRLDYYNSGRNDVKWKISPRLGVSSLLSEYSKIYFNFGYFYQPPETNKLFGLFNNYVDSTGYRGNPQIDLPEKISYELGLEMSFLDRYLLHVSGYYNNYDYQIGETPSDDTGGEFSYTTYANNAYGDIEGIEISLRKKYGNLFRGFLSYNLNMGSYREEGFDIIEIRPKGTIRLLLVFDTPDDWGKTTKDISTSILYTRTGGDYFSFDPLAPDPFAPVDPNYINNLKWQDESYWYLSLSKDVRLRGFKFSFYAEINNLFNSKYITDDICFRVDSANTDKLEYLRSLHLPMYGEERYAADTLLIAGNDHLGEIDKAYINKPDFKYLYYTNPRFLRMGVRVDF